MHRLHKKYIQLLQKLKRYLSDGSFYLLSFQQRQSLLQKFFHYWAILRSHGVRVLSVASLLALLQSASLAQGSFPGCRDNPFEDLNLFTFPDPDPDSDLTLYGQEPYFADINGDGLEDIVVISRFFEKELDTENQQGSLIFQYFENRGNRYVERNDTQNPFNGFNEVFADLSSEFPEEEGIAFLLKWDFIDADQDGDDDLAIFPIFKGGLDSYFVITNQEGAFLVGDTGPTSIADFFDSNVVDLDDESGSYPYFVNMDDECPEELIVLDRIYSKDNSPDLPPEILDYLEFKDPAVFRKDDNDNFVSDIDLTSMIDGQTILDAGPQDNGLFETEIIFTNYNFVDLNEDGIKEIIVDYLTIDPFVDLLMETDVEDLGDIFDKIVTKRVVFEKENGVYAPVPQGVYLPDLVSDAGDETPPVTENDGWTTYAYGDLDGDGDLNAYIGYKLSPFQPRAITCIDLQVDAESTVECDELAEEIPSMPKWLLLCFAFIISGLSLFSLRRLNRP